MSAKSVAKIPTFQELFEEIHSSEAYLGIFPETFTLINIMMTYQLGAIIEIYFSFLKMVKSRLRSWLSDENLDRLLRIAIEGPELESVNYEEVLDI